MSEFEAILSLIEKISQLSGAAIGVGILFAFYKGIVVWGWQFREQKTRADTYESLQSTNNVEIKLRLVEAEKKIAEYERHAKAA